MIKHFDNHRQDLSWNFSKHKKKRKKVIKMAALLDTWLLDTEMAP